MFGQDDLRKKVIETARIMAARKLTVGTWGNVSLRDDRGLIHITPSGVPYEALTPQDIVSLDIEGVVVKGFRRPSVESGAHLAVYRSRPEIMAVVHTHPLYSGVFAALERDLPACGEDFALLVGDRVLCAPYAPPGTPELAARAVEALGVRFAVILSRHGAICVGTSPEQALTVADVLEKNAQIAIMASSLGNPRYVTAEETEEMKRLLAGRYGQKS
jgi:L-fuculose-phosphate aldolase